MQDNECSCDIILPNVAQLLAVGLTAAFALRYPAVSTPVVSISRAETNIAQSLPRISPPLSALFGGRFADSWSEEEEARTLQAMAATHLKRPAEYDEAEMLDVVLANQQESFASDVRRLERREILQIVKKRRSV